MADPSAAMYGSVFLLSMRKVPYTKPYLTINEQILLLRTRGMTISDSTQAERDLLRLGYYRLSGYWYPFRVGVAGNKPRKQLVQDNFCAGTNFEQVMQLYEFDRKLRLLFLDAIEIIETAVRVAIVFQLGKYGAWAHRDPHCLDSGFSGDSLRFDAWIAKINASEKRAGKTEFVRHFNEKYSDPYLPIWIAIEIWDFGTLSMLLDGMSGSDQALLARRFRVPK